MTLNFSRLFPAHASPKGEQACLNARLFSYLSFHSDERLPNLDKHQAVGLVPSRVFSPGGGCAAVACGFDQAVTTAL